MSGCAPECEQARWLGAAGKCVNYTDTNRNATIFECVCPEGYWGRDDWDDYGDCHVNKEIQKTLWMIILSLACLACLFSLTGMVFLVYFWDFLPQGVKKTLGTRTFSSHHLAGSTERSTSKDDSSNHAQASRKSQAAVSRKASSPAVGMTRVQRKQRRKKKNSRRISLLSMILLLMWSGNMIIYIVPMFYDITRADRQWYQDICASMGTNSLFVGLWFFFYVWYMNLPSLRHYGKLFGVDSILIRKPTIIRVTVVSRVLIINTVTFALLFLFNQIGLDSPEQRRALDTAFIWFCVGLCLDFSFFTLLMVSVFDRLFAQLEKLSLDAVERGVHSSSDNKQFAGARRTLRFLRFLVFSLVIPASGIFILMAIFPEMRDNLYLSLNANIIVAMLGVIIILGVFVFMMRGQSERPRNETFAESGGSKDELEGRVIPAAVGNSDSDYEDINSTMGFNINIDDDDESKV